jgi:prostaglandin-H2 D-isomerase / glutathione transferase
MKSVLFLCLFVFLVSCKPGFHKFSIEDEVGKFADLQEDYDLITVSYFDGRGRGEAIRLLLHHAKVPFIDHRFDGAAWRDIKYNYEFLQVPALKIGKQTFVQTNSILRLLGRKFNYYPEAYAYEIDSLLDAISDFVDVFGKYYYYGKEEEKQDNIARMNNYLSLLLQVMENRMKDSFSSAKYLVGETMTIADFSLMGNFRGSFLAERHQEVYSEIDLNQYPLVKQYLEYQLNYELKDSIQLINQIE